MKRRFSHLRTVIIIILIAVVCYLFIGGIGVFLLHHPDSEALPVDRFYGDAPGPDRALIVEGRAYSADVRIHLIEEATTTIQVAYYAVHDGLASDIFYASLIEAADRGVAVQLLFDGIFHNLKGRERNTYLALIHHPNIEIRFFEPASLVRPWTLNNRLHDKFIIVDSTKVLLGGRNIGDKYYLEEYRGSIVQDRDVLIFASEPSTGVLGEFDTYFTTLWEHRFTHLRQTRNTERKRKHGEKRQEELLSILAENRRSNPDRFGQQLDLEEKALVTNKVTLITNPITRLNKEPRILVDLIALAQHARLHTFVQSPYIIPSRAIRRYYGGNLGSADHHVMTNSISTSPNYFALSAYLNHRRRIERATAGLYEYTGTGSIHAKSYVFDGRISAIGSFNLDPRSAFLSTESMVVIDSEPVAQKLIFKMEHLVQTQGTETRPVPWHKRVLVGVLRIILFPFDELL
jgi:putative cardiolipin synthase